MGEPYRMGVIPPYYLQPFVDPLKDYDRLKELDERDIQLFEATKIEMARWIEAQRALKQK